MALCGRNARIVAQTRNSAPSKIWRRIVEQALLFYLNVPGIVLSEALKAWPSHRRGVSAPIGRGQLAQPVAAHTNTSVYYRNFLLTTRVKEKLAPHTLEYPQLLLSLLNFRPPCGPEKRHSR